MLASTVQFSRNTRPPPQTHPRLPPSPRKGIAAVHEPVIGPSPTRQPAPTKPPPQKKKNSSPGNDPTGPVPSGPNSVLTPRPATPTRFPQPAPHQGKPSCRTRWYCPTRTTKHSFSQCSTREQPSPTHIRGRDMATTNTPQHYTGTH